MTPKELAAMQQALGALEQLGYGMCYAAIELREALAEQAEQEPVAWIGEGGKLLSYKNVPMPENVLVYLAPIRTKDLTDDEIADCGDFAGVFTLTGLQFARAVIAADRENNK